MNPANAVMTQIQNSFKLDNRPPKESIRGMRTHYDHYNKLTGPGIDKAEKECREAKRSMNEAIGGEVFSAKAQARILQAAAVYAGSCVALLESQIAEDNHRYVQNDMRAFDETMANAGFSRPSQDQS